MTPPHDIDAVEIAIHDLARGATGRLVAVTLGVPPATNAPELVEALKARLRQSALADLNIITQARAGMLQVLAAEFARGE